MEKVSIEILRGIEMYLKCCCSNYENAMHKAISELEAYRAADSKPEPPANTVRVRIPVAVDESGGWFSSSVGSGMSTEEVTSEAQVCRDCMPFPLSVCIVWVEVYVPIPKPQTVKGTVSDE